MLYGNYAEPNPPAEVVRAVGRGEVDVALVWGPLAGFFASQSKVPLRLEPVTPWFADNQWPMQFDVSVGVQKDNQKLLKEIDRILARRRTDIAKLLASYHVPVVTS
jgi:mxaJ protein